MAIVNNLVNSIKTRTSTVLGSDYSELAYVIDYEKNNFKGNEKRYGVNPNNSVQSEEYGVIGAITLRQEFEIVLTDVYSSPKGAGDLPQRTASINLQEKCLDIYDDLIETKAGLASSVINITDMVISEIEYVDNSNIAIARMNFNIQYRR